MDTTVSQAQTIGELCAKLGPQLIEIVAAPAGLGTAIRGLVVQDRHEALDRSAAEGSLVLLIGVSPGDPEFGTLLKEAGAAGVSAIACHPGGHWPRASVEIAEGAAVAILSIPPNVPWGELYELLKAALGTSVSPATQDEEAWGDFGDLSGIAESVAAIAGGPVAIEDMNSRLIAFSGTESADEMRTNSILNGRVPHRWLSELHRRGVTQELLTSDDVIRVTFEGLEPRRAIAIRLGKSVLGSIWLAGDDQTLSAEADAVLRGAARVAALRMMRQKLAFDVERQMRESSLGAMLRGVDTTPTQLRQLGLDAEDNYVVVAIEAIAKSPSSPPTSGPRVIDLVSLHLRSYARPALGTSLADPPDFSDQAGGAPSERIYFLAGVRDADDTAALARIVTGALDHTSRTLGVELRGSIGHVVDSPRLIAEARRSAEDCLDLERHAAGLVQFDKVHARALLAHVEGVVSAWRGGTSTAFKNLIAHDEENGTEYVETLVALMDAFGNASTVAARMHIHANTVRYRIRRITEICDVDLADGTTRLALELEIRSSLRLPQI